jgi:hypothetical protein
MTDVVKRTATAPWLRKQDGAKQDARADRMEQEDRRQDDLNTYWDLRAKQERDTREAEAASAELRQAKYELLQRRQARKTCRELVHTLLMARRAAQRASLRELKRIQVEIAARVRDGADYTDQQRRRQQMWERDNKESRDLITLAFKELHQLPQRAVYWMQPAGMNEMLQTLGHPLLEQHVEHLLRRPQLVKLAAEFATVSAGLRQSIPNSPWAASSKVGTAVLVEVLLALVQQYPAHPDTFRPKPRVTTQYQPVYPLCDDPVAPSHIYYGNECVEALHADWEPAGVREFEERRAELACNEVFV